MSLTSCLKSENSGVRKYFSEQYPNCGKIQRQVESILSTNEPMVEIRGESLDAYIATGMSINYLLAKIHGVSVHNWRALRFGYDNIFYNVITYEAKGRLKALHEYASTWFLEEKLTSENLLIFSYLAIYFSFLEDIYRGGGGIDEAIGYRLGEKIELPFKQIFGEIIRESWAKDLSCLVEDYLNNRKYWMGMKIQFAPTFCLGWAVRGADADFIAGNELVEIKTTIQKKFDIQHVYQMLGYLLLDNIDYYRMSAISLYLPRQRQKLTWKVQDFLDICSVKIGVKLSRHRAYLQNYFSSVYGDKQVFGSIWKWKAENEFAFIRTKT